MHTVSLIFFSKYRKHTAIIPIHIYIMGIDMVNIYFMFNRTILTVME